MLTLNASSQINYNDYFTNQTLRLNYIIAGNKDSCNIFFNSFKSNNQWGGRTKNLDSTLNYGDFLLEVYNLNTKKKIYSIQYNTLFQEWQTTEQAKTENHAYRETVIMPLPKEKAIITISKRDKNNNYVKKFETIFNPESYFTNTETQHNFPIEKILTNGKPSEKIDIVFLPEGYTQEEMQQFKQSAQQFTQKLFSTEPYKSLKHKFNISAILAPSPESGVDIPGENVWKKTLMNFSYYTFDMDRYLTSEDHWAICDLASAVPYDQIIVLCNSQKYGGGGIYNFYSVFSAGNKYSLEVMLHEFGHGFAGLGDEYEGNTTYQDFFSDKIEPVKPNLTTLTNFSQKWERHVSKSTPIPTPKAYGTEQTIGAFEGGGYCQKGIYRPQKHCMMHDLETKTYCKICLNTIIETINYLTE